MQEKSAAVRALLHAAGALTTFGQMTAVSKAWIAAPVCLGFALFRAPGPYHDGWIQLALLAAALVLVPLALELFAEADPAPQSTRLLGMAGRLQLPAGLLLALSCWLPRGWLAAGAALPWMVFTALLAGAGFVRVQRGGLKRELHLLAADVALMFTAVGGAWTLADRGGLRPLGFDAQIVALTSVHFHYAGLLLPLFAGLAQQQMWMSRLAARAVVGSVLGVPAVALGITATQWRWSHAIEAGAGCGLALAGMAVAVLHVRLALDARWPGLTRLLLGLAGVSLFFTMVLAALYASRAMFRPFGWLDLPQMQALHGTINVLGFGLCGVLGWRRVSRAGVAGPPV